MKDSINHALLITGLLERDIARICASGNEAQQGLAADCAEHRMQIANKLRMIEQCEYRTKESYDASRKAIIVPSTLEQSAELRKLDEQSFKAGDFNGDINEPDDDTYMRHAAVSDAKALAEYQQRVRRLGWIFAGIIAISAGVVLAGIKIWFTYFQ